MEIQAQQLEYCKYKITYHADTLDVLNKRAEIIKIFKKAPVPGNRKGHADNNAINMHYRKQIDESLKRAMAEDAFHNTIFEKKFRPYGVPKFNSMELLGGKFICEFELFTKPEFELTSYKNLEVPKPHQETDTESLTEKMLQGLRLKFGEVTTFSDEDVVTKNDNIIVNYTGSVDGVELENLTASNEMLTVGESPFPIFDENLIGMKVGEKREFSIQAPENVLPSFAGKKVDFKAELVIGSKTTPCPLNDELAIKVGKENFQQLRDFVSQTAAANLANDFKSKVNDAVKGILIANHNQFMIPNYVSLSEAQYLVHSSKLNWETISDQDKEKYLEIAEKNVRLALVLDKIREEEPEAQLSDQEIFDIIKTNLVQKNAPETLDQIMQEMSRTGYYSILAHRIKEEYTLDFIVKSVRVLE